MKKKLPATKINALVKVIKERLDNDMLQLLSVSITPEYARMRIIEECSTMDTKLPSATNRSFELVACLALLGMLKCDK